MNRTIQLLGLLLIGLLSYQPEPVGALPSDCFNVNGCHFCRTADGCLVYTCGSNGAGKKCG